MGRLWSTCDAAVADRAIVRPETLQGEPIATLCRPGKILQGLPHQFKFQAYCSVLRATTQAGSVAPVGFLVELSSAMSAIEPDDLARLSDIEPSSSPSFRPGTGGPADDLIMALINTHARIFSADERDDLVNEVWISLRTRWGALCQTFDPSRGEFIYWLRSVIRNAVIDAERRLGRQRLGSLPEGEAETRSCQGLTPPEQLEVAELQLQVRAALKRVCRRVPTDTCLAFRLYWLEGSSMAATAARLGLKPRQVQKRCSRVLNLLRSDPALQRFRLRD
jgi:RNA polymerase sigma factor (sigma-70 family)